MKKSQNLSTKKIRQIQDINGILQQCCEEGDLETLQRLFSSSAKDVIAHPNTILGFVAERGHLNIIKYLLTSSELKENADIMSKNDNTFRKACQHGHLELVKYILNTPLGRTINFKDSCVDGAIYAAMSGQLDVLKYFLTELPIEFRPSVHCGQDKIFKQAILNGHLNIIQYVLTSNELSEHIDIHTDNDVGFDNALQFKHLDILKYFIFDLNIHKTPYIEESLTRYPNKDVNSYFEMRNLNIDLTENLEVNLTANKTVKV